MANPEHLELLRQGVEVWNAWRVRQPPIMPDLEGADLSGWELNNVDLSNADLHGADLRKAQLRGANLRDATLGDARFSEAELGDANLSEADLNGADLSLANLRGSMLSKAKLIGARLRVATLDGANLAGADAQQADLFRASLIGSNLSGANLEDADLDNADLTGADLSRARLVGANLRSADLDETKLIGANLSEVNLRYATLRGADLSGASLRGALLVETGLENAVLTGCFVYGIAAWNIRLSGGTKQQGLVITGLFQPEITVDNIEVAQFVYLLLHNEKIRDVIDTVGKKGVLLLGRFTEGRIEVLERLREELRKRDYVPIVFNFDKPSTKDFTETVRLLAGLSKFVIADITNPKSSPLELQATVPEIMVPFQPIIAQGEKPFAMLQDLWIKHRDWVFEPIEYSSIDRLIETMDAEIIDPAERRFDELVVRRAEVLKVRRV
jgi:uncharacterized protein YjbI with pentapeptide repeats